MSIKLGRSHRSESYERRFVRIDNILAEIFGISGLLALIVRILFGPYSRWEADQYIVAQVETTSPMTKQNGSFFTYVRSLFGCRCCRRAQLEVEERRETLLKEANSNVDIIELTRKLRTLETRLRDVEKTQRG